MAVIELEIQRREPYAGGQTFGETGSYDRIDGIVTYAVDPDQLANASIIDLARAPRDKDGHVRFTGDLCILTPSDSSRGNRRALIELPNRGRKLAPRQFNRGEGEVPPTRNIPEGDGFLFRHGYHVAWVGWQWDVFRDEALMGLEAPEALVNGEPVTGQVMVEIHPNVRESTRLLANRLHIPYSATDTENPDAMLYVRDWEDGPDSVVPRERWQFAREEDGEVVPSVDHIYMEGGFEPGKIYHLVYSTTGAPVVGAGLLAARDIASFLKYDDTENNPLAGLIDYAFSFGMSQTGRMQRHYLSLGLNLDEEDRQAYDGMLVHVAGGRRGEFNHRFGQPSVQSTPSFGHRFPFADDPLTDPLTGQTAGLLDAQRERGGVPRIFYINTSAEYWRGDCSLVHIDPSGEHDLPQSDDSRAYLFAGTQHGPGTVPQGRVNTNDGGQGRFGFNAVEYSPLLRAALVNLDKWTTEGAEPPPVQHPSLHDGTATDRESVLHGFTPFPGMHLPDPDKLPVLRTVDVGPDAEQGIGSYPVEEGRAYPAFVSATDEDGNEVAGIRLPDLTVPLGTHTGWNPRDPETGAPDQIMPMQGFSQWFAVTREQRIDAGDPRPSILERYRDRDDYLEQVRDAATKLADQNYVLAEDIDLIVADAAERWDYVMNLAG
ncbi:MAG: alpha/beta hydrolase domain-containing protein [Thermomicrobiales bacterium]